MPEKQALRLLAAQLLNHPITPRQEVDLQKVDVTLFFDCFRKLLGGESLKFSIDWTIGDNPETRHCQILIGDGNFFRKQGDYPNHDQLDQVKFLAITVEPAYNKTA